MWQLLVKRIIGNLEYWGASPGMLGHSSPSIVSTYAKVADESRKKAIQKLNDARESHCHTLPEADRKALTEYYRNQKWVN